MRGPVPKPTRLRVLEGNRSRRPLPKNEPVPESGSAACPPYLTGVAREVWRTTAPKLLRTRLLTSLDGEALAAYCLAVGQLRAAWKVLAAEGSTFLAPSGYPQQRPEVAIANRAMEQVRRWSAEFGLTPAARARIQLPELGIGGEDDAGILS